MRYRTKIPIAFQDRKILHIEHGTENHHQNYVNYVKDTLKSGERCQR